LHISPFFIIFVTLFNYQSLKMKKTIEEQSSIAHGLCDEADASNLRLTRNKKGELIRLLLDLKKSYRNLESTGIIPKGYDRYMNDMFVMLEHRITFRK
jgi:hypothetical protein